MQVEELMSTLIIYFTHIISRMIIYITHIISTSPPSAREAAMNAMQHETFLKHLENFLETSLKHSGNILENHETTLKKASLKLPPP